MKLPNLPFFQKSTPKEFYLSLLFHDEHIQAVIFEEISGTLRILNHATQPLPLPLEDLTFEKLLTLLDKVISTAESALPSGIQTHKTIFGLKEDWVDGGQIKKNYLATLKRACDELDLQPIGFLVFPEAIAHLLQQEEGAPVSAVFIEIGPTKLTATLLRAGRIISSRQGPIVDGDLPKSADTLLAYFVDVEILPSRIIVADDSNRGHLTQSFIHHHWSKTLPFLHVPQVTTLPEDFAIRAVLYGTATQMGFKVSETTRLPKATPSHEAIQDFPKAEEKAFPKEPEETIVPEEKENEEPMKEEPSDQEESIKTPHSNKSSVPEENADDFGFVQNADVAEKIDHPTSFSSHLKDNAFQESEDEIADETFEDIPEHIKEKEEGLGTRGGGLGTSGLMLVAGMKNIFRQLRRQAKKGNFSGNNITAVFSPVGQGLTKLLAGPKLLIFVPIAIAVLLISVLWYIFGLSASVTLFLNPQQIDASQDITLTTKDATDLSNNTLGASLVSVDENGSTTTDATGTKDTGDKAKGTVTLYNNNTKSVSMNAGSTITSSNNLKFTIDKDVTVASASGDEFSGTKPGTTDVSVTANTFGTDYNLPSGTKFATTTSGVVAKNDNAFSGGTKKSLTVVSASDISKATDDLTTKLQDQAKQDMQQKNGAGSLILPIFTATTLSKKSTDKNVGDQATSVTLTATVTFESFAYTSDDLKQIAQNLLKDKISDGMSLTDKGIQSNLENATPSKDGTSVKATLHAKAALLPKIDTTSIAQKIAGKPFTQIKPELSDISQLDSADVKLSPNLFFLPKILPRLSSHIKITVSANE